jgi:hypothetical protein
MKDKIWDILENVRQGYITVNEGTQQVLDLFAVSGAKRKVCPVCKKSFEKGWGEFCSQDCWDTDM